MKIVGNGVYRWWLILSGILLVGIVGWAAVYIQSHSFRHKTTTVKQAPILLNRFQTRSGSKPAWVYWYGDKLYVSYFGTDIIDICTSEGQVQKSFSGTLKKGRGTPQGMAVVSNRLFVADYTNKALEVFKPQGDYIEAYNKKPNQQELIPVGVAVYNRVVYLTDLAAKGWVAIGDVGEFIIQVGGTDKQNSLQFPYGITVTPDGRVIVTDPATGKIKVFSCRGQFAYDFPGSEVGLLNPQGIVMDGLGRIQVVDNGSNQIFVYSNDGYLLYKYGEGLERPTTMTVDQANRHIYVANTEKGEIVQYGY